MLNPVMFARISENTLHVFGAVNFLTIPIVWAFYPETSGRTLEEMDHLFMSSQPFVWDEEAEFARWKEEAFVPGESSPVTEVVSLPEVKSDSME